jgi:DNA-directed RNA polymerase subunit M/transcription elongation factor TFIIS
MFLCLYEGGDFMSYTDKFNAVILQTRIKRCEDCNGMLKYTGAGIYKCQKCGKEQLDDFGKVKKYLDENGPTSQYQIHMDTGVDMDVIDFMVKKSRLECTEDSPVFFKCESCGQPIKSGSICASCAQKDNVKMRGYNMSSDVGDRPMSAGHMRFIGK